MTARSVLTEADSDENWAKKIPKVWYNSSYGYEKREYFAGEARERIRDVEQIWK